MLIDPFESQALKVRAEILVNQTNMKKRLFPLLSGNKSLDGWGDDPEHIQESPVQPRTKRRILLGLIGLVAVALSGYWLGRSSNIAPNAAPAAERRGVTPGDFERQEGLLLAWVMQSSQEHHEAIKKMITAVSSRSKILILTNDETNCRRELREQIASAKLPIRIIPASIDSMWVRDYGPITVKLFNGDIAFVDCFYSQPCDDAPQQLARLYGVECIRAKIALEGGNILSNGAGLLLSTEIALETNAELFGMNQQQLTAAFQSYFGGEQVLFLEALQGEPTQHVDMFAAFTAPDTVVVGQCDPQDDPENAALLDRNAERLAGLKTACGPLKVVRIPMPPRSGETFLSYTNIVFANGVLIVPDYPGVAEETRQAALDIYRRLLPDWEILTIQSDSLIQLKGGPHCITMNLHRLE